MLMAPPPPAAYNTSPMNQQSTQLLGGPTTPNQPYSTPIGQQQQMANMLRSGAGRGGFSGHPGVGGPTMGPVHQGPLGGAI